MIFYIRDSLLDTGNLLEVTSLGKRFAEALGIPIVDFSISNRPEAEIELYLPEFLSNVFLLIKFDNGFYADSLVNFSVSGIQLEPMIERCAGAMKGSPEQKQG